MQQHVFTPPALFPVRCFSCRRGRPNRIPRSLLASEQFKVGREPCQRLKRRDCHRYRREHRASCRRASDSQRIECLSCRYPIQPACSSAGRHRSQERRRGGADREHAEGSAGAVAAIRPSRYSLSFWMRTALHSASGRPLTRLRAMVRPTGPRASIVSPGLSVAITRSSSQPAWQRTSTLLSSGSRIDKADHQFFFEPIPPARFARVARNCVGACVWITSIVHCSLFFS